MKTKTIVLTLAGLGLTTALMASGPQSDWDGPRGEHKGQGMHQKGEHQRGMHRRGGQQGERQKGMHHRGDQQSKKMRRGQRAGFMKEMGRQLDLTKEQRQKIRDAFKEERKTMKTERKAQRGQGKKRGGMFGKMNPETFMSADHFDKDAYTKAAKDQADKRKAQRQSKRQERLGKKAAFLEKIFNILTPEQRVKWIELSQSK